MSPQPFLAFTLTSIDNGASFHAEARYQLCCAACGSTGPWEAHHVLSQQHCRRASAPRHSPDNALRLCAKTSAACHERHTNHQQRLPISCLRDANLAFLCRWLGPGGAYEYLGRYYSGTDARRDALLALT